MSIIASGLSYRYSNRQPLFSNLNLSVPDGAKVSLIGSNGTGKSTLLQILAGRLTPTEGSVAVSSHPYYIPQQTAPGKENIAELLGVSEKVRALRAICSGSVDQACFDILGDDWDIEERCRTALDEWGLRNIALDTPATALSGGEHTKAILAGLSLHEPETVLLDEPTNHLDGKTRAKLYDYIRRTHATLIAVSHDIALLNILHTTCELTSTGIRLYGGNYDFYKTQCTVEDRALTERIEAEQTALRTARKRAQEVRERQERRVAQGERSKSKAGMARIVINARSSQAQNSSARLRDRHAAIIDDTQRRLTDLRKQQSLRNELKIDIDDASIHTGKRLIRAEGLNFCYPNGTPLWSQPLDIEIHSGDRVHIYGDNGSGKTTLVRLLLGELTPTTGTVERADLSAYYLDQEYKTLECNISVLEMAERHNAQHLADHELKIRLNRALFPPETWDKTCRMLSGGERMRLSLCCMTISDHIPDLLVLDEPTNNLDIESLTILTDTIRNYRGTLLVISHDEHFIHEAGVTKTIEL